MGERSPSEDIETWALSVVGLVSRPLALDWSEYLALDHRLLTFDIHCVTSWTRFDSAFTGVPLAELVDPVSEARFVSFSAYSSRGHHTSLPLGFALDHSWVVHEFEGEPLAPEHGGPVRVVTPGRYFYKSIKWLRTIEVLEADRLGWWELNSSYHNDADPFAGDQRFTTGSLRPDQLRRFLEAASYEKYRGRVMIGLDLTDWAPASPDLRRLYLKNCALDGIDLSGSDLRGSNLSLSHLTHANLQRVDLSGSDLEGADFTGADLSGANLTGTALSATRFENAKIDGADFTGSWGLVESQERVLRRNLEEGNAP